MMDIESLIKVIVNSAYNVRMVLGPGFLESVYKNALGVELTKQNIPYEFEYPMNVFYEDEVVGEFRADILVDHRVIVELKAVNTLAPVHEALLVNYLHATQLDHGLLINFGAPKIEVKRKYRHFKK
jgi:GxxExxY protein